MTDSPPSGMGLHPALVAAARFGLNDVDRHRHGADCAIVEPFQSESVLDAVRFDRLDGMLAAAVAAGRIVGDDEFSEAAAMQHHAALRACVALEALAVRTIVALDADRIPSRLLKGPALAHLDFTEPEQRCFGDVDLLIAGPDWERATVALEEHGYVREQPELRAGFDRRFGKGVTMTAPNGLELDLHRRFASGRFGITAETDELFADADAVTLGGYGVAALAAHHRLLHACYHEAIGGFRGLRAARDVAQLILVSGVDWRRTVEAAQRWRSTIVVATAISDTWALLALDPRHPAAGWARQQRPTCAERSTLRAFRQPQPFRRQALTAVPVVHGIAGKARYLAALGVPSRANRAARHRSLGTHLWQSVGSLVPSRKR